MPRTSTIADHEDMVGQTTFDPDTDNCAACAASRTVYPNRVATTRVFGHGYTPSGGYQLRRAGVNDTAQYYMGVELETDSHAKDDVYGDDRYSDLSREQVATMALPVNFWEPTQDSSITGIEFVSHPATFAWWKANETELREMFRALLHAGYRAHDNGNCGMHVSISHNAFEDERHLYRFLTLVHFDPEFMIALSQRNSDQVSQWCDVHNYNFKKPQNRKHTAMGMVHGNYYDTRYVALNTPDSIRYEFRMPRGTLRFSRFMKNLEWVHSMVEFTRNAKLRECKPTRYVEFVKANSSEYPNLAKFLWERGIDSAAAIREERRNAADKARKIAAINLEFERVQIAAEELREANLREARAAYNSAAETYREARDAYDTAGNVFYRAEDAQRLVGREMVEEARRSRDSAIAQIDS